MYGSDALVYDFEGELANAKTAKPKGNLSAEQVYWRRNFPESPTEEAFRKHRHSHGGEGIAEVAGSYDLKAAAREAKRLEPKAKRNRRTNAELRAEVLALHERGLVPTAIADVLNLSDRRVKTLVQQAA